MVKKIDNYFTYEYHFCDYDLSDLKLLFCGHENCKSMNQVKPYTSYCYVIHFILSGKGIFTSGDKSFSLDKGMCFIVFPDQVSQYSADKNDPWSYVWIGVKGSAVSDLLANSYISRQFPIARMKDLGTIHNMINNIIENSKKNEIINIMLSHSYMLHILAELISQTSFLSLNQINCMPDRIVNKYIKDGVQFINANINIKLTVSMVARHLGLNRSYFSRIFTKYYNQTPCQYILRNKLTIASHLLLHSNLPVSQVAQSVGFSDSTYFTRQFTKHFLKTPTEFNKNNVYIGSN